jgi:hypothetical protein
VFLLLTSYFLIFRGHPRIQKNFPRFRRVDAIRDSRIGALYQREAPRYLLSVYREAGSDSTEQRIILRWRRRCFAGDRETCDWDRLFASPGNGRNPIARATRVQP